MFCYTHELHRKFSVRNMYSTKDMIPLLKGCHIRYQLNLLNQLLITILL